jgi:hypothetical protein
LRELEGNPRAVQALSGLSREAAIQSYIDGLWVLFWCSVGLAFVTFVLQALTGLWSGPEEENQIREGEEEANETHSHHGNGEETGETQANTTTYSSSSGTHSSDMTVRTRWHHNLWKKTKGSAIIFRDLISPWGSPQSADGEPDERRPLLQERT